MFGHRFTFHQRSWRRRRRPTCGSGTEAREAATERAALRMVALGVLAAQAARFRYADGWLRRLPAATTGRSKGASSRT